MFVTNSKYGLNEFTHELSLGRSREARENERNAADSKGGEGGGWRGRGRGGSRGGYGGRGGRGGRMGPRGMGSRDQGRNYSRQEPQEVDTWDNTIATNAEQIKQDGN